MRLVGSCFEVIDRDCSRKELIEKVARVCYKSEDRIGEGTADRMVKMLIDRGHHAMLEHASIAFVMSREEYMDIQGESIRFEEEQINNYKNYLRWTSFPNYVISGNMRAWKSFLDTYRYQYGELDRNYLNYIAHCEPDILSEPDNSYDCCEECFRELSVNSLSPEQRLVHEDVTVKFTVDRGISHEIVRHRDASFAQESTRYCNYSKDKFGNEITCIDFSDYIPQKYLKDDTSDLLKKIDWLYGYLTRSDIKPQISRNILPNCLKTEIVMTANLREWRHFLELRTDKAAHPQMREVTIPLNEYFKEKYPIIFK